MTGINRWSMMINSSLQVKFQGTKHNGRIQRYGANSLRFYIANMFQSHKLHSTCPPTLADVSTKIIKGVKYILSATLEKLIPLHYFDRQPMHQAGDVVS